MGLFLIQCVKYEQWFLNVNYWWVIIIINRSVKEHKRQSRVCGMCCSDEDSSASTSHICSGKIIHSWSSAQSTQLKNKSKQEYHSYVY